MNDAFESDLSAPTTDCNDAVANVHPGATEVVGDGIDQDCNGQESCFDDDDNDGYLDTSGDLRVSLDADCLDANEGTLQDLTTDCNDTVASVYPGATEITGNGVDENCDGFENCFDDDDDDGYLDSSGDLRVSMDADCQDSKEGTNVDPTTDCDDLVASVHPNADETCNGIDDDCDTFADDADPDDVPVDALPWYADVDDDTFGDPNSEFLACEEPLYHVVDNTDCDDQDPQSNPALPEDCGSDGYGDEVDNNCDGRVDEGCLQIFPLCDADQNGVVDDKNNDGAADVATWTGDYTITDERIWVFDCTVTFEGVDAATPAVLTIDPGAELRFAANQGLNSGSTARAGVLLAQGTEESPIVFTGKTSSTTWKEVRLYDAVSGMHTFEYVELSNATYGINVWKATDIWMDEVHIFSTGSAKQYGVRLSGQGAYAHIEDSTFGPKVGQAIAAYVAESDIEILRTEVRGNSYGYLSNGDNLVVFEDNVFVDNTRQIWARDPYELENLGTTSTFSRTNPSNPNSVWLGYTGTTFEQEFDLELPLLGTNPTSYDVVFEDWTVGGSADPTLTIPPGVEFGGNTDSFNIGGTLGSGNLVADGVSFSFTAGVDYGRWELDADSELTGLEFISPALEISAESDLLLSDWVVTGSVAPLVIRRNGFDVTMEEVDIAGNTQTGGVFATGPGALIFRDASVSGTKGYGIYSDSAEIQWEGSNTVTGVAGTSSFAASPSLAGLPTGAYAGVYCAGGCTGVLWTNVVFSGNSVGNYN